MILSFTSKYKRQLINVIFLQDKHNIVIGTRGSVVQVKYMFFPTMNSVPARKSVLFNSKSEHPTDKLIV
jgi:hypothetical protein